MFDCSCVSEYMDIGVESTDDIDSTFSATLLISPVTADTTSLSHQIQHNHLSLRFLVTYLLLCILAFSDCAAHVLSPRLFNNLVLQLLLHGNLESDVASDLLTRKDISRSIHEPVKLRPSGAALAAFDSRNGSSAAHDRGWRIQR